MINDKIIASIDFVDYGYVSNEKTETYTLRIPEFITNYIQKNKLGLKTKAISSLCDIAITLI